MARRGTLFDQIKSKNPKLADSISKVAKKAFAIGQGINTSSLGTRTENSDKTESTPRSSHSGGTPTTEGNTGSLVSSRKSAANSSGNSKAGTGTRSSQSSRIVDCYIGLDFGTSCSKVVIRLPNERRVFPVNFGPHGHPTNPYLLPNTIWGSDIQGSNRKYSLSRFKGAELLSNLKMNILQAARLGHDSRQQTEESKDAEIAASYYLAEVIKLTKDWFCSNYGSIYDPEKFRWWCNVGVPAESYSEEEICSRFGRVALLAWKTADATAGSAPITSGAAMLQDMDWKSTVDSESVSSIQIVPEMLATVGGYVKSNARKDGPHILIDVGAGTLDLCSFRFQPGQGNPRCIILSANVALLGVLELERRRIESIVRSAREFVESHEFAQDPVLPIRNILDDYLPSGDQLEKFMHDLEGAETIFENECGGNVGQICKELRNRRDPNYLGDIPTVLSGGGSNLPIYNRLLENITSRMRKNLAFRQLQIISLTSFRDFPPDVPADQLSRHGVAIGLSYPRQDLGEISKPQDVADIPTAEKRRWEEGFVGNEQV